MELSWLWNMTANPIYWRLFMFSIEPDSILKSSTLGTNKKLVQEDNSKNKIFSAVLIQQRLSAVTYLWRNSNEIWEHSYSSDFCCPHAMPCYIFCNNIHGLDPFPQMHLSHNHHQQHYSVWSRILWTIWAPIIVRMIIHESMSAYHSQ